VVNGSREYLAKARPRYPELLPVWIEVSPDVLRTRLAQRTREDETAIAARLARHRAMQAMPRDGIVIRNDGPLAEAGEALVTAIACRKEPLRCA